MSYLKRKKIETNLRINKVTLIIAFLVIAIMPLAILKFTFEKFTAISLQKSKYNAKAILKAEATLLKNRLTPENWLSHKFHSFDEKLGFKTQPLLSNTKLKYYSAINADNLRNKLNQLLNIDVACVIHHGPDTHKITVSKSSSLPRSFKIPPGILLRRFFGILSKQSESVPLKYPKTVKKIKNYQSHYPAAKIKSDTDFLLQTTFKNIISFSLTPGKVFKTVSAAPKGTGTTFFYYQAAKMKANDKSYNLGGYLAVIKLKDLSPKLIFRSKLSRKHQHSLISTKILLKDKNFERKFASFEPISKFHETAEHFLLDTEISNSNLVHLVQQGSIDPILGKPNLRIPVLSLSITKDSFLLPIFKKKALINFLGKLLLAFSLFIFTRIYLFGLNINVSISAKIVSSIALVSVLPFALLALSQSFYEQYQKISINSSAKQKLSFKISRIRKKWYELKQSIEQKSLFIKQGIITNAIKPEKIPAYLKNCLIDSQAEQIYYFKNSKEHFISKQNPTSVQEHISKKKEYPFIGYLQGIVDILETSTIYTSKRKSTNLVNLSSFDIKTPKENMPIQHKLLQSMSVAVPNLLMIKFFCSGDKTTDYFPSGMIALRYSSRTLIRKFLEQLKNSDLLHEKNKNQTFDAAIIAISRKKNKLDLNLSTISPNLNLAKTAQIIESNKNLPNNFPVQQTKHGSKVFSVTNFMETDPIAIYGTLKLNSSSFNISSLRIFLPLYFIVLLSMAILFSRILFVSPILNLSQGIQSFSNGKLNQKIEIVTGDEFEHLSKSFNKMAKGLIEKEKMAQFVSQDVLEEVSQKDLLELKPGGEKIDATIMFCSLKGLKSLSLKENPEEYLSKLNRFIELGAQISKEKNGVIDKIIEDTLMIVFRDSEKNSNHSYKACLSAQILAKACQKDKLLKNFFFKSGISSGSVISGKVGSRIGRLDFTVIGDTVNLASRLKSVSFTSDDHEIIGSETTINNCLNKIEVIELSMLKVKGKKKQQKAFKIKI
jgi:class 3 adenylate cyclase